MHEKHKPTFPNATPQKWGTAIVYKINKPEKANTLLVSAVICDNVEKI